MPNNNRPIKSFYTIQDLENLSGIKAHTIRIWEKRYGLFDPLRTGNNVRVYQQEDVKKWLNVATLYQMGYKISSIAELNESEMQDLVLQASGPALSEHLAFSAFKLAMVTFDQPLFDKTYRTLVEQFDFTQVMNRFFLPLLEEIGLVWQTGSINVAHEHFMSNLIKQKVLLEIEKLPLRHSITGSKFVLFLPDNEIHELGLLFSHYLLGSRGYTSIYLGASVPMEALASLQATYPSITFISAFTVEPAGAQLKEFLQVFSQCLLRKSKDELWVSGRQVLAISNPTAFRGVRFLASPQAMVDLL